MKYQNTTQTPICVQVSGTTQFINPGQEVVSNTSLVSFGLTALIKEEPMKVTSKSKPLK